MIGMLLTAKEAGELEMLLKAELDELLCDVMLKKELPLVKRAMEERYRILFGVYGRIASEGDKYKYQRALKMLK